MPEQGDWRDNAFELYRLVWELLERCKDSPRDDVQYYVFELREALVDLKQAVVDDDPARGLQYLEEVELLVAELLLRFNGE